MKSTVEQFRDWLAQQPADATYNYHDNRGCAYFQFLEAIGAPVSSVGPDAWRDTDGGRHPIPEQLQTRLTTAVSGGTFGGLLKALEGV